MSVATKGSGLTWVGRAIRRLEDPALLTGHGRFTADLPAAHWVRFVRSPAAAGKIERIVAPEGGLVVTSIENNRRAQALRKRAATQPPPGTNVIVVTHRPNILDAFGKDWFEVKEGEASIFKPDGAGGYKTIVRLQANDWSKLAQTGSN